MEFVSHTGPHARLDRHRHAEGYAALVLAGGYLEAGDAGRFRVAAGDVLLHAPFEAHFNRFGAAPTALIDLPLATAPACASGRVGDPDGIARIAEKDRRHAADQLLAHLLPAADGEADWPDVLASDLRRDRVDSLTEWAAALGLRPGSVSRGFRLAYGLSPQRYRLEARARRAVRLIDRSAEPLARIAAETGFADQAHMTRTVRALTGRTPRALLRAHCVQ